VERLGESEGEVGGEVSVRRLARPLELDDRLGRPKTLGGPGERRADRLESRPLSAESFFFGSGAGVGFSLFASGLPSPAGFFSPARL